MVTEHELVYGSTVAKLQCWDKAREGVKNGLNNLFSSLGSLVKVVSSLLAFGNDLLMAV